MNKLYYICKYTPVELLQAMGADCAILNEMPESFERAEQMAHPNLCGFGKALLESVLSGKVKELILVNCCDTIRSVYDVLKDSGQMDFLYLMDMLHSGGTCSRERAVSELKGLIEAYGAYRGSSFDEGKFRSVFGSKMLDAQPHISVLGARMGEELFQAAPCRIRSEMRAVSATGQQERCRRHRSWTMMGCWTGMLPGFWASFPVCEWWTTPAGSSYTMIQR